MKLLIVAALIAVNSAARLDNLRSYLPPDNNQGNFRNTGFSSNGFGSDFNSGLGSGFNLGNGHSGSNGFGSNEHGSNGFGTNQIGQSGSNSNGNGQSSTFGSSGSQGTNGFGSNGGSFSGSNGLNQYLPPNQGSFGFGNGFTAGGSSIKPACSSCSTSRFSQQYNQASSSVPSTSYGVSQFASSFGSSTSSNGGSNFGSGSFGKLGGAEPSDSNFGSTFGTNGNIGSNSFESQGAANRQYLAPKPSSQNPPQQPFDEKYGYFY